MIHNDTTRSAERRNTLSFSVYLCVCLFLEKKRGSQKKKEKNGSKLKFFLKVVKRSRFASSQSYKEVLLKDSRDKLL